MIAIAFCRKPLRALVSFRIGNWALGGRATEEGRIKTARCGRSIQCETAPNFRRAAHIATISHNLHFFATRCPHFGFVNLRGDHER